MVALRPACTQRGARLTLFRHSPLPTPPSGSSSTLNSSVGTNYNLATIRFFRPVFLKAWPLGRTFSNQPLLRLRCTTNYPLSTLFKSHSRTHRLLLIPRDSHSLHQMLTITLEYFLLVRQIHKIVTSFTTNFALSLTLGANKKLSHGNDFIHSMVIASIYLFFLSPPAIPQCFWQSDLFSNIKIRLLLLVFNTLCTNFYYVALYTFLQNS